MDFVEQQLTKGAKLYVCPTTQFKTTLIQVFIHQPLRREEATKAALLPAVLERGNSSYPNTLELKRALEELFGAQLNTSILKKGEDQVISFSLEIVDEALTGGREKVLKKGWELLSGVISDPLTEGDSFREDYVRQEKDHLAKMIRSLINNKTSYAVVRCLQEMCKDEPYGIYKFGREEDLPGITSQGLYSFYRRVREKLPVGVYVIGNVELDQIASLIEETPSFTAPANAGFPVTIKGEAPEKERFVEERRAVKQGKLSLGYRTGITYGDEDYYPLLFYNGILGGFPHSKLFQNVREKASLAYYASSNVVKHKGILFITSGIEEKNYSRALEIILEQVGAIARGEISEDEMENTRMGLRNQLLIQEDNPSARIQRRLDGTIAGKAETATQALEAIDAVTKDDVVRVAGQVKLDTVYFLHSGQEVVPHG